MTPLSRTFVTGSHHKPLWLAAILIVLTAGAYFYYSNNFLATRSATGSEIQTAIVQRGDLVVSASGTWTLTAQTDASFGFDRSGQVTEIYVKVGNHAEAGQVLAQLDDTLAQMEYVEAQQALEELYSAPPLRQSSRKLGQHRIPRSTPMNGWSICSARK